MKRLAFGLFAATTSVFLAGPAFAGDGDLVTRLMGKPPGGEKSYACFNRVYDLAHMAAHPQQSTKMMKLLVTMEQDPESKQPTFQFLMGLTKRGSAQKWSTSGGCGVARDGDDAGPITKLGCGVDCDGGGLSIAMGKDDASIRVSLDSVRITPQGSDDPENGADLSGPDDKLFRLDRVARAECAPLLIDRKERAALARLK